MRCDLVLGIEPLVANHDPVPDRPPTTDIGDRHQLVVALAVHARSFPEAPSRRCDRRPEFVRAAREVERRLESLDHLMFDDPWLGVCCPAESQVFMLPSRQRLIVFGSE